MTTPPTGIRIIDCKCGCRHPEGRAHCVHCGKATLYGHELCEVP